MEFPFNFNPTPETKYYRATYGGFQVIKFAISCSRLELEGGVSL